jgi:hypothetical protein
MGVTSGSDAGKDDRLDITRAVHREGRTTPSSTADRRGEIAGSREFFPMIEQATRWR